MLGALGRRINGTPGLDEERPGIAFFLVVERRPGGSHYAMRPRLRRAIDALPDLRAILGLSVEAMHTRFRGEANWPTFGGG